MIDKFEQMAEAIERLDDPVTLASALAGATLLTQRIKLHLKKVDREAGMARLTEHNARQKAEAEARRREDGMNRLTEFNERQKAEAEARRLEALAPKYITDEHCDAVKSMIAQVFRDGRGSKGPIVRYLVDQGYPKNQAEAAVARGFATINNPKLLLGRKHIRGEK